MRRVGRVGRSLAIGLAVVVVLAVSAVIAWRVFAPHETLTAPSVPYPEEQVIADDRPYSELRAAPLVVENRIRVYAEKWRVWSDAPVGERYETTPYWAFRRWPAQVVGVVSVNSAVGPVVVTQWSDGEVVAIDARLGEIAWRARVDIGKVSYDGRRTGASTVYEPRLLRTVESGERSMVIVLGQTAISAFDPTTGHQLWGSDLDPACAPWTMPGLVVTCDTFLRAENGTVAGTWTGRVAVEPALCELGLSQCHLLIESDADTEAADQGGAAADEADRRAFTVATDGTVSVAPPLEPGAVLAGGRVVYPTTDGVVARSLDNAATLWSWQGKATLIAADDTGVYLINDEDRTVLGLSPVTGVLLAVGCASSKPNEDWRIAHIHTTDGPYLALERVTLADSSTGDQEYFYGPRPIALVEMYTPTKLPVWPGKFAACRRPL